MGISAAMKIGAYDLYAIETGRFRLDGGAMFGVVPRPLWEKTNPPDERNRITLAARALLVVGSGKVILIDVGNGDKFDEKFRSIYAIESTSSGLLPSLARHGFQPADVTDVILTHLHFDHAGGCTRITNGEIVPAFPNAKYHVQREHWEAALHPTEKDRASFVADDFVPLERHGVVSFLEGDGEIFPGINVRTFHGHTSAMQCPVIGDRPSTLLYGADLLPTASHLRLPWIMGFDVRPLVTLEEKRQALAEAADEDWLLFFEHDPSCAATRLVRTDKGIVQGEGVTFE